MSWRIVVVANRGKLDLKLNYLVVRQADRTSKIFLSEIGILIIENTSTSITASLLCELVKRKIKVIFCDEKRNPISELVSIYGSHDSSRKIRDQIAWSREIKELVWTEIVIEKIRNQREILKKMGKINWEMLDGYVREVGVNDPSNREGHAAKVYFNSLFGNEFSRGHDNNINAALNYGYALFLSAINREIVALGYITQLGIFHKNVFNHFNFGSDLIEPFRTLVDYKVANMDLDKFEKEEKMELVDLLNKRVEIDGKNHTVLNAIRIYVYSVCEALEENDLGKIKFFKNEL